MNAAVKQPKTNWSFAGSLGANPIFLRVASTHMSILGSRIDDVLTRAAQALGKRADEAESNVTRAHFFEASMGLVRRRDQLKNQFLSMAGRPLRDYCRLGPTSPLARSEDPVPMRAEDMRILDDRDVAETLAYEGMVEAAEGKFKRDIHALSVRLAELAHMPQLTPANNPVAPDKICRAFRAALDGLECELEARLAICEVFDHILARQLDQLYDPLNELLARAGIAPNIRWEPRLEREEKRRRQARKAAAEAEAAASREQDTLNEKRGYLDGWLYGSIQWLLSQRRKLAGDHRDESTPGIETGAVSRVLNDLQNELAVNPEKVARDIDEIKRLLVQQIAERGESQHRELALLDENVLDAVGMMFDFVGADTQLPEPFQLALSKLQIPYLKVALHDPSILSEADAPAKLLLNELAQAGLGWNRDSDPGERMLQKVENIVERIIREYNDDPGVFEELHDELQTFMRRQQRRAEVVARRENQAMAGQERLRLARRDVGRFLVQQTERRHLPPLVDELIRKSWSHVMVLTLLKHGRESQQWRQAVATVRELVWSVTFQPKPDSVRRLRTRLPVLAKTLARGLRQVGYGDADIRKLLFNMKKLYTDLIRDTGSDRVIVEASAEGLVIRGDDITQMVDTDDVEGEIETIDDEESLSEVLDSVRTWKAGQWVMFHRGEGEPLRAKLSWVSPITGRYLFVNQRGMKALECSMSELAENLIGEKVQPLDDEEIVTRAMSAVASRLQDDVPAAA